MLKKLRVLFAVIFWIGITLLFLDFTGLAHKWLGWMAKVQFLPALLAGNFIIVAGLVILTLIFGRLYCSVICPLGVMQDGFAALGRKAKKNRYSYSPALKWLRLIMLGAMAGALAAGISVIFGLLAPYSSYGRIVSNLLQPVWIWGNNLLAGIAEKQDSYAFYSVDVWFKSIATLVVAVITLVVLGFLAWKNGRTYCNTICPVGTVLGCISKYSWLKPVIDTQKCVNCGKCGRNCKAACIDTKNHTIDYTRCVTCFDCIGNCSVGAISYRRAPRVVKTEHKAETLATPAVENSGRRDFLTVTAVMGTAALTKAQIKMDGGLAVIQDKKIPERETPITPPGSQGHAHLSRHCTGCQLCIAACPNGVLRPSSDPAHFMQPEVSYERGYCRPECTRCSEVCPAGAIHKITREEKTTISVGHAVTVRENCIPLTDGRPCGNCERHCPSGAITMVPSDKNNPDSLKIPVVDPNKCMGCGACENLCPARPLSAIYVEGNNRHISI